MRQQDYYRDLYRLLGQDGGIEKTLNHLRAEVIHAKRSEAVAECDRNDAIAGLNGCLESLHLELL